MHSAPAVSFPVGRSRFQGWLLVSLAAFSVLLAMTWVLQADAVDWRQWLVLGLCLATSSVAWWQWQQAPLGHLSWDGVMWNWSVDDSSVVVLPEVVFDFQNLMLLRLCATDKGNVTWAWLDRAFSPLRWMALRRAVYGQPRREADPLADLAISSDDSIRNVR